MSCTWLTKWGDKSSQRLAAGCRRRVRFSFCICLKRLAGVRDPKGNVTRTYNLSCILARCRPPLLFLSPLTASLCLFQAVPPATVLLVTTSPFNRFRKCPSRVHVTSNLCSPVTSYRFNKHPGISHAQQHPDLHLLEYIYIYVCTLTLKPEHTHTCAYTPLLFASEWKGGARCGRSITVTEVCCSQQNCHVRLHLLPLCVTLSVCLLYRHD